MSGATSSGGAFDLLHPGVQRWIWEQNWRELRDIQERAIPSLLDGQRDLIISASTASGKTEAAFLPIVSRLASEERAPGSGFAAIYVSPLRALINDQFGRLESLCEALEMPVTRWHGDVAASVKARARARPGGIVLTTPESLEALLVHRGPEAPRLFRALSYIVIDEMHAFLGSPRGRQLQSLLHRIETAAGHPVARVGLSATLADMETCRAFLRPADPGRVDVLVSATGGTDLRLQLRGYVQGAKPGARGQEATPEVPVAAEVADAAPGADQEPADEGTATEAEQKAREALAGLLQAGAGVPMPSDTLIVQHLFETLRGRRGLVFGGSRARVELLTVGLNDLCERAGVPGEFVAHHGSLSREHREEAERRMKDQAAPATAVSTTTMELGLDIGHIDEVAGVGEPHAVSSLRQQLGRSGRREGRPAVMRLFITEAAMHPQLHPVDALRPAIFQTAAMLNLMLARWNEPPVTGRLHLSTLVQQILALISQHGGITALQGWRHLVASRVFPTITQDLYAQVLRRMGDPEVDLIEQAPDGLLLPGREGERVLAARDFYAVFNTPEEFVLETEGGHKLGTVPVDNPMVPEQMLVFGGRRWRILNVDLERHVILVAPARGGKPPVFGGEGASPADGVLAEMRRLYASDEVPVYLDAAGRQLLAEGRRTFQRLRLAERTVCQHEDSMLVFPWVGGRRMNTLFLALVQARLEPVELGLALSVPARHEVALRATLAQLEAGNWPDPMELAALVPEKAFEKYDRYLGDELLTLAYASERMHTT